MSSERFEVELTETAERVYRKLFDDAQERLGVGDESNSKVKLFHMVDEALTKIIPHDPLSPSRALSGHLSNIFRVKKGRIRICYVASSKHRKIIVLYISEKPRKAGDVHDPYEIFTQMVLSGTFDATFARLGIKLPDRKFSESPQLSDKPSGLTSLDDILA